MHLQNATFCLGGHTKKRPLLCMYIDSTIYAPLSPYDSIALLTHTMRQRGCRHISLAVHVEDEPHM